MFQRSIQRQRVFLFTCILLTFSIEAQDSLYTRKVIKFLCSEFCYGRGYLKNGLQHAEKFLSKEVKTSGAFPLFSNNYTQTFVQSVNTFPKKCEVTINGKKLQPGKDFIPDPSAGSTRGLFKLTKVDSTHFIYAGNDAKISLQLKNKLTYSVAKKTSSFCGIEIDKTKFKEEPQEIKLNIEAKLISEFKSKNIGCFLNGTVSNDSLIVFSAHYDHLGGLGKTTYFPGANDNASGVSVILNLLKYYSKHSPKYKTVFLFFAGEEAGLLGSKYFVENSPIDLKKIKFLINLDLLGTGDDGIMVVNGTIHEKEFSLLTKINTEEKLVKDIRKRGKASNSDHYWFSEADVPCFFIYTMGGIKAYHDVYDIEKTLPLTEYTDVFKLVTQFVDKL